jgi:hypothetical protein
MTPLFRDIKTTNTVTIRRMNYQWAHDFIDTRVLDDRFDVDEFDNFRAVIHSSTVPLFQDLKSPWHLVFNIDNEQLTWDAIEYEDEDDPHGEVVLSGTLCIKQTGHPKSLFSLEEDDNAIDFIQTIFPKAKQVSYRNVFEIDGMICDFDSMEFVKKGYFTYDFTLQTA